MDLEKQYAEPQKKYGLPQYRELNHEFEFLAIGPLQQIDFPLRFIRRRMCDRFGNMCNFFQSILQPSPGSYILFRESSFYTGEEKQQIQELLQQMMAMLGKSTVLEYTFDEKRDAVFILEAYHFWQKIKGQYITLLKKLEQGWKKKQEQKPAQNHYFG